MPKKVNALLYLLPFLFGILGGLGGYFLMRERDKKLARNLLWYGVIVTLIVDVIVILLEPEKWWFYKLILRVS